MKNFMLFTCLLLALTVAGCAQELTKEVSSTPTKEDPLNKLTKSFSAMGKVRSFRAKTTTYDAVQIITTEFQAPDRFHFVSSASSDSERYMIAGTDYYKVAPAQWQKNDAPGTLEDAVFGAVDVKRLKAGLGAAARKKFIGTEVLEGEPTLVYEYAVKKPPLVWTFKIWIDVSTGRPRKLDILAEPPDGLTQTHPGYGSTTDYYDYNKKIKIKAPIK